MIVVLFSCEEDKIYNVPKSVEPFIEAFRYEGKIRGYNYLVDNITIDFISDDQMPEAMALTRISKGRIIMLLNTRYWDAYEIYPMRREAIIMHEFGHYPLMRNHNNIANSLMSGQVWSIIDYEKHRDEMLNELFK